MGTKEKLIKRLKSIPNPGKVIHEYQVKLVLELLEKEKII